MGSLAVAVLSGTVRALYNSYLYGAECSSLGHLVVLGLIIGAIFVQFASWSWVFWFVALVCMPIATLCIFLIPKQEPKVDDIAIRRGARWKSLDIMGVSILTGRLGIIL